IAVDPDSEEGRADTRELGCALNREFQRRGIMTEAITATIDYLFKNGIINIWACCFQNNAPSKGMIEKCGFQFQRESTYYSKELCKTYASYEYLISVNEWKAIQLNKKYLV
ncbi:MAG: GNAT family protein, partial [Oscillospiraceae bacterium]